MATNRVRSINKSLRAIFNESSNFDISFKLDENNKEQIIIEFLNKKENLLIRDDVKEVVNFVIEHCKDLNWNELNNLVNSTYGILNTSHGQIINIDQLAMKYKL